MNLIKMIMINKSIFNRIVLLGAFSILINFYLISFNSAVKTLSSNAFLLTKDVKEWNNDVDVYNENTTLVSVKDFVFLNVRAVKLEKRKLKLIETSSKLSKNLFWFSFFTYLNYFIVLDICLYLFLIALKL